MKATSKSKQKHAAEHWKASGSAELLDADEQLAHAIVSERCDLMPSVDRIMLAPLDAEGRLQALTMFRDSLRSPGDPNRDPRVAIAACLAEHPEA